MGGRARADQNAVSAPHKRVRDVARRVFDFASLRPGQEEAIAAVLAGHDTLAVMPTGSGKSAIYQIPAVMLDGPTVVVSPLIALQRDQSLELNRLNTGGAVVVNSLLPERAQADALTEIEAGDTEFLFLAPEQLANPERLEAVKAAAPSLFVVDEAHCISEWGHSFRPDYLRLKNAIEELGHPTVLALTATANEAVRAEIIERLGLREPRIFISGFDRPNIWLGVETCASEEKKRAMLLERVRGAARPGIIYANTRRHAEEIRDELNNVGIPAAFYHGGLNKKAREEMQQQFMNDEAGVIVATSAFGMGIDKPDVRFVFHFEPPDSLDSYYQEIGRAGRDGAPASAVLFYNPRDLDLHKFFKGGGQICTADVQSILDVLTAVQEAGSADLQKQTGLSKTKFSRAVCRLEDLGAIEFDTKKVIRLIKVVEPEGFAERASQAQNNLHEAELLRIEQMRLYAENLECRRAALLRYFGEEFSPPCGNCDNCQGHGTDRAELIAEAKARAMREDPLPSPAIPGDPLN